MVKTSIKYIENKSEGDGLAGHEARIGRVTMSKTGKTIRYRGAELQSLKGAGFKANYFDEKTGDWYWVSNPRKDGNDTLYGGIIDIDEDVREEYWTKIRNAPERILEATTKSVGKH